MNMFFARNMKTVTHPPLRGVNLGGWLVLEKWITPSLFRGTESADEYSLCQKGNMEIQMRLRQHRDSFITIDDFVWLQKQGIQAVRLPIGYWVFGDEPPYSATIEYVDKAFAWARDTGIFILLDMHAAPGSQNGLDHSGRIGACNWADEEHNVIKTLAVIAKLAGRYRRHPNLLGFELLNEPKWSLSPSKLKKYYTAAYKLIRKECGPHVWVVFYEGLLLRWWLRSLRRRGYTNVVIDTHQYQAYSKRDKQLDLHGHIQKTLHNVPQVLARLRRHNPIMIGEWSLAGLESDIEPMQLDAARRDYGSAQLLTYGQSSAWFYWTYRTEEGGVWSYRDCVARGWLPTAINPTDTNQDN